MKFFLILLAFIVLVVAATAASSENVAGEEEILALASNEDVNNQGGWKPLDQNETVPRGSHVKLDMTSGEKWVKVETRGEKILQVLEAAGDEALVHRVKEVRDALARTNDTTKFELDAVAMWEERQHQLKREMPPAQRLLQQLDQDTAAQALDELDEKVEEIDFAKQFARFGGLRTALEMAERQTLTLEIREQSLGVLAKSIKWIPELQDECFKFNALERVWTLFNHTEEMKSKSVMFFGALLRGSGERGVKECNKIPALFPALKSFAASPATEPKLRVRVRNLIDDLLQENAQYESQ